MTTLCLRIKAIPSRSRYHLLRQKDLPLASLPSTQPRLLPLLPLVLRKIPSVSNTRTTTTTRLLNLPMVSFEILLALTRLLNEIPTLPLLLTLNLNPELEETHLLLPLLSQSQSFPTSISRNKDHSLLLYLSTRNFLPMIPFTLPLPHSVD